MSSYATAKENDLSLSSNKKHTEKFEQQISKLQLEITKKDKEISTLQSELQVFKKSTNNTSSQFPLPSEFKKQWLNLIQSSIMDSFDTIYSNSILLSIVVQRSIQLIYGQTQKFIRNKIIYLLNCLGMTKQNEEVIQVFFIKFRKILLQDYYKTIFCCNDEFVKNTIDVIKNSLIYNDDRDGNLGYSFTNKDKEDIVKDLNANVMIKFIEEAFGLCLYMGLHDPPLTLNIKNKPNYFYYCKSEYINIEGFAKDNSPCLMILYPPILKVNSIFNGIKAAVYACETVNEDIIRQCEENKKYQNGNKKKASKALSDGEGRLSSNTSNEGCFELNSPIDYNTIDEHNQYFNEKKGIINSNHVKGNYNQDINPSPSPGVNLRTFNTNHIDNTRHRTKEDNNTSIGNKDKSASTNNQVSMFDVNEGNSALKLTMNSGQVKNDKRIINPNTNSNSNQRSKSLNKAYPNVITKHLQKLLPNNYKIQKEDAQVKSQLTSNILTFNKTKLKENILKSVKNNIGSVNGGTKDRNDKSNSNISSAIMKSNESYPNTNTNANTTKINDVKTSNRSNSPNHIIDKSRNNNQLDQQPYNKHINNHTNTNNTNSNANKSKYEIIKTADKPISAIEIKKQNCNSPTLDYLRTPVVKRKEYNKDNKECSSRRDTQNQNNFSNILHTNINDILSYNTNNDRKYIDNTNPNANNTNLNLNTSNSIIDSKGNYLQTSIKRNQTQPHEHSYLRKMISDTSNNYQFSYNQANVNEIVNEQSSDCLMRFDSKSNHQRKANISNSNSTSHLMRTNSQPEEINTYYGHTLNKNDSSLNSQIINNSDNSQTSINNNAYSSNQINNKGGHLFPSNLNCNSRTSILNHNNSNKDLNSKLEYNNAKMQKTNSKNSPTIIFNALKKINPVSTGSGPVINPTIKTESNITNSNSSNIPTVKGPNSNRVTNHSNSRGLMVTNDFKITNGVKRCDYPTQKKNSLGSACTNKRKHDVQLNYDISLYQFQTMDMHSPSFRTEKDKAMGSISQYSTNRGDCNSNSNKTAALVSTFGNNTTCTDNQNLTTKYTVNDGNGNGGGCNSQYDNYIVNGMKQKKNVGQANNQSNHFGVKIETSFGIKK